MRKNKIINFLKRKDVLVALSFCLVAVIALTGVVMLQGRSQARTETEEKQLADLNETPAADDITLWPIEEVEEQDTTDESSSVAAGNSSITADETTLTQEEINEKLRANNDMDVPEDMAVDTDEVVDANSSQILADIMETLNFTEDSMISWPIQGNVIIDYSMDKSVYFSTLDQYKYNPAIIISAEVNGQVKAAAPGVVSSIDINEETGTTMIVDLGNGYTAAYGQLKEVPLSVGDSVQEGAVIGYISEPTKYYSVEGSNLYFKLTKDGNPIDPMIFLP